MKTLNHWFDEYSISHQNKINKGIHYICVPVIFFSIVGLLMSIPCLLYTSDAADDMQCVDLGGRRIIKKIFFKQKTAYEM